MYWGAKRLLMPILDTQSAGRSKEALISLAQAKTDFAVDAQIPNKLPNACRLPRALPKPVDLPFLPFWAHQQDRMSLPCHRAFLGGATHCQRLPVTGATGDPSASGVGPDTLRRNPRPPQGKVRDRRVTWQGKKSQEEDARRSERTSQGEFAHAPDPRGRVCLVAFYLALKAKVPRPLLSFPDRASTYQTAERERAGGFGTPDTGRCHRQNKNRRERSHFQETKMSCYNGVELPPSPGNASQSPLLPSHWISHSFFLRVPMEWGAPSRHHRKCSVSTMVTITPRRRTKGSQVFTNPPMLQNGKKKGKGFKRQKSAEKDERERRGGESLEKSDGDRCPPDHLSTASTATSTPWRFSPW